LKENKMDIILKNPILNDEYTEYVYNTFDIQNREETISTIKNNINLEGNWNVGVIYGGSGSGKTTILKEISTLEKDPNFDEDKPLISNYEWMSPQEATQLLSAVGLGSVPTWLRPYRLLSNGEQYRARVAYTLGYPTEDGQVIGIDEYTSVVDRNVALSMSFAVQKYIRKMNKRVVLASCHSDILDWLMPDWTYSPIVGQVETPECLRRPEISLQIHRTTYDTWHLFKSHHYLTEDVSKACKFYLFTWNDVPVGINCVIPQPSGWFKHGFRESRIVVLPDFQGLGLGVKMSEITGSMYTAVGYRYFTKTVHPALGEYRNNHPELWKPTSKNGVSDAKSLGKHSYTSWNLKARKSYCHEYAGQPMDLDDTGFILKSTKQYKDESILRTLPTSVRETTGNERHGDITKVRL
jgi:ABC-type lipoprotein export system ATPase subunit/GNAT superfamily N-acetyltransferase